MKYFIVGLHSNGKHNVLDYLEKLGVRCGHLFSDLTSPSSKIYNSYNYELIDNLLVLKDEIILPYFITQNPYRLQEVDGNTNLEVVLPTPLLEGNNIQSVLTL